MGNGIVVDAGLRTSDPAGFAVGDVARARHPLCGLQIRVEHWANALNQPATVATSMLGGEASHDELPYFFTDQYDLGMEHVGFVDPGREHQVVFRGDAAGREFIAFWLADGRVQAGMNVNVWDVTDHLRKSILGREAWGTRGSLPGSDRRNGMATVGVRYIVDAVDAAISFHRQHLGLTEEMHPAPSFAMLTRGDLQADDPSGNPIELFEPTIAEARL